MRQGINSVALLVAGLFLAAAQLTAKEFEVDSRITDVTVYPTQAQITRSARTELGVGDHSLIFENIPSGARPSSFRASLSGPQGVTLLGLNHRQLFHTEALEGRAAELEREIARLNNQVMQSIKDRLDVFKQQKKFLSTISQSATTHMTEQVSKGGMQVSEWRAAYTFVSDRLRDANDSLRIVNLELDQTNAELQKLSREFNQVNTARSRSSRTVQIDVRLSRAGKVNVELEYVITGATWSPLYDARMDEKSAEVELNYLAEVTQRTGEDWKDVRLTLSTANPASGTGPGEFAPWTLAALPSSGLLGQLRGGRAEEVARKARVGDRFEVDAVTVDDMVAQVAGVMGATIAAGLYSTTFNIERKETIPSGEKAVRTSIGSWPLTSKAKLISRPRNREGVYRQVTLTNQEDAPLMPGRVSIFAASDFLGHAGLADLVTPGQEFELPFGLENTITSKREIESYKVDRNRSRVRIEQTVKITLTNNGAKEAALTLEEPLPVSQDKKITVRVGRIEPEPTSREENGKLLWDITLAPGEEKIFLVPLRIEHPADMPVAGL